MRLSTTEQFAGEFGRQYVAGPDETRNKLGLRLIVNFARRSHLLDAPAIEHSDTVAHAECLTLIVSDENKRDADIALNRLQFHLHLFAQFEIECSKRFVEQQHLRPIDQRPRQGNALALSTAELARLATPEVGEANILERCDGPLLPIGPADSLHLQAVLHVLLHGHMREQGVVLKNGVHVAVVRRVVSDIAPGQQHCTRGRRLEAGNHAQHRGLAAARGTE